MKVEVAVLGFQSLIFLLCGRKATFEEEDHCNLELRSCVKVEVDVLGSPYQIVLSMVSVDLSNI